MSFSTNLTLNDRIAKKNINLIFFPSNKNSNKKNKDQI
jgi:hypothetical protein